MWGHQVLLVLNEQVVTGPCRRLELMRRALEARTFCLLKAQEALELLKFLKLLQLFGIDLGVSRRFEFRSGNVVTGVLLFGVRLFAGSLLRHGFIMPSRVCPVERSPGVLQRLP